MTIEASRFQVEHHQTHHAFRVGIAIVNIIFVASIILLATGIGIKNKSVIVGRVLIGLNVPLMIITAIGPCLVCYAYCNRDTMQRYDSKAAQFSNEPIVVDE